MGKNVCWFPMGFLSLFPPQVSDLAPYRQAPCVLPTTLLTKHTVHEFVVEGKPSWFTFLAECEESPVCGNMWDDESRLLCVFLHQLMLSVDWKGILSCFCCYLSELCFRYMLHCESFLHMTLVEFVNVKCSESLMFMILSVAQSATMWWNKIWSLNTNLFLLSSKCFGF